MSRWEELTLYKSRQKEVARNIEVEILEEEVDASRVIDIYRFDPLLRVEIIEFYESLNKVDKIVFAMKIQGYTVQEIADHLGVSRRRVRQRLERIKKRMEDYI